MENNPLAPRQRNRRADRYAAAAPQPEATAFQEQPVPQPPVQPSYVQQPRSAAPQAQYQRQSYSQTPQTMYQQPSAAPMRQPAAPRPAYPSAQPPRPRALTQQPQVNSGWQQPTLNNITRPLAAKGLDSNISREELPRAEVPSGKKEKPASRKLPKWLTWSTVLCFFLILSLFTAYWLMQAYLVTEENRRTAARQATLANYHITEQADGRLTITWQEHIEKYAAQYNLQPAFVAAIIRNESSFRANAESNVGARGLMQMMPDTAEWIAGKLDDDSYTFDSMWDAETNIRYGCWYLGYLTRLFHGDPELISAAYHAGQTTITQWLSDKTKSSDGVSLDLDKLSDGPTKQYIGRVTQTYGIYQTLLYPDEAFGTVPAGDHDDPSDQR